MRMVIQKVKHARLTSNGTLVSEIGAGLIVFLGVCKGDGMSQVKHCANKVASIRIFRRDGKMNDSVRDVHGEVLVVSNFTLCTGSGTGARPDFSLSAEKSTALDLYLKFAKELKNLGVPVKLGAFGQDMQIETQLDGPTTIYKEFN